jgi:hypothetical protein
MKNLNRIIGAAIIFFSACNGNHEEPQKVSIGDSSEYSVLADTIITDVVILNQSESEWTEYTIRKLNNKALVDKIFKAVYSGKLQPYEFFNDTPLTIKDIKVLEKKPEFKRDNIGKVQFEEAWYYDTKNQMMIKKVHSIMLAYEFYNSSGEFKGYKPAFKIYFNQ